MADSTTNGNDGTAQGAMLASDQVAGKIAHALKFDGAINNSNYVNVQNATSLDTVDAITIEMWVKPDAIDTARDRSVFDRDNAYFMDITQTLSSTTQLSLFIDGDWRSVGAGNDLVAGVWNYIVGTYD